MSADLVEGRAVSWPRLNALGMLPLAQREAWRMLTSPALAVVGAYLLVTVGMSSVAGEHWSRGLVAEFAAIWGIFFGIAVFPAVHLTATSARRTGAEGQLAAAPQGPLHRDLALCLGVVLGPGLVGLVTALLGKWAAGDGVEDTVNDIQMQAWTLTDVLQLPALAIGSGILAVVIARWLPFPGSLLIGLFGMVFLTLWVADQGKFAWLSWFVVSSDSVDDTLVAPGKYLGWHTVYLFAWSALGLCAVGLRQASRKRGWFVAMVLSLAVVVAAGILQIPPYAVELFS